jgi:hypothetical protein
MPDDDSFRRSRRRLSWAFGLGIGALLGSLCVVAGLSAVGPAERWLSSIRPSPVESEGALPDGQAPYGTVRSFLRLEQAQLFGRMERFVTARAAKDWFDPKSWGGSGRLVRFDVQGTDPTTATPRPEGPWRVVVEQVYQVSGDELVRRRFLYVVVQDQGRWLIDDYEVSSSEQP